VVDECSATATILDVPGATYEMTENFSAFGDHDCVVIAADGITLDCKNYSMRGQSNTAAGVSVQSKTRIAVKNCNYITSGFGKGIYLNDCTNCVLSGNWMIMSGIAGIHIDGGSNITLSNNKLTTMDTGLLISNMNDSLALNNNQFCENVDTGIKCENSATVPTGGGNTADTVTETNCTIPSSIYTGCV